MRLISSIVSLLLVFTFGPLLSVDGAVLGINRPLYAHNMDTTIWEPALYELDNMAMGSLQVSAVVLTVFDHVESSVGMSFRLDEGLEQPFVLLFDEEKNFIAQVEAIESPGILNKEQNRHVYKSSFSGLSPSSVYYYVISKGHAHSILYEFHTINVDVPTVIGFFGDAQGYKMSQYDMLRTSYDIAIDQVGTLDISYLAGDIVDTGDSFEQWGYFYKAMADKLSSSLWISAIGNHDVKHDASLYIDAFNYPANGVKGLEERNFYVDIPNARIAVLDTESFKTYEEQGQWLKDIMREVDDRFKIVLMHRSVYPMSYDEGFVRKFSKVFDDAKIDLVLSGHDHIYNRTTVREEKKVIEGSGTTYIVGGSPSGSKFYDEKNSSHRYWKHIVYDGNRPVFTVVKVSRERIDIEAFSISNGVAETVDEMWISK